VVTSHHRSFAVDIRVVWSFVTDVDFVVAVLAARIVNYVLRGLLLQWLFEFMLIVLSA
jgi:hypothetical protein